MTNFDFTEIPVPEHLRVSVDNTLHSIRFFEHSYWSKGGDYVYAPEHARPVVLIAEHAGIRSSAGLVIPEGHSAIVSLTKYGGRDRSNWVIRLYAGLDTAEQAYQALINPVI